MTNKDMYKSMAINLFFMLLTIGALSLVILFIWNVAGVWMGLNSITYLVSLALSTTFIVGDMIARHWITRFVAIRQARAIAALDMMFAVSNEVIDLKVQLKEKGIL